MYLTQSKIHLFLLTLLCFLFSPTQGLLAETAISCHCFQDRAYNPADRFAADDYILATSFNSLLSKVFDIPKKQIVMLKMKGGIGQGDLLVALKIAKVTGVDLQQILDMRKKTPAWSEIITDLVKKENINKDPLLQTIQAGASVNRAGAGVADEIIGDLYGVTTEKILKFRLNGLNEKEMALLFILAHAGDKKPEMLIDLRTNQGQSWSEIANGIGVEPAAAGKLILHYPARQLSDKSSKNTTE